MKTFELSRRELLKAGGALIVSFKLFPALDLFAAESQTAGMPDPTQLDSWIAVAQDGTVTVFTSKVELGTGIKTALAQIAAEELDVPLAKINVDMGDTDKTIDQATTSGSRTIERAGPQIRQAAPRREKSCCASRRKGSARPPTSSPSKTASSASPAIHQSGSPTRSSSAASASTSRSTLKDGSVR